MSRLLERGELEHTAELVAREARTLLEYAERARAELEQAKAAHNPAAAHVAKAKLARIARMLTRAQCNLVHPDDPRYHAAQAVAGYCNEADDAGPWHEPAPPLLIGVAS